MNITEMLNLLLEGKTVEVELNDEAAVKTLKNNLITAKTRAQRKWKGLGMSGNLGKLEFDCIPNAIQESILVRITMNDAVIFTYKATVVENAS